MDYAMFIYKGIAIHMAYMVAPMSYLKRFGIDCFGSHGCIRLSEDDAKSLFKWALMGTPVKVLKWSENNNIKHVSSMMAKKIKECELT